MDIAAFLGVVRRRWLALVLCLLAGFSGAVVVTRNTPETYRASARLIVNIPAARTPQEAVQGVQLSSQLLASYAEVATSRSAAQRIKDRLDLPESVAAVRGKIAATPQADTLLITVSATDRDPARARSVADAASVIFIEAVEDLEQGKVAAIEATIVDRAELPTAPFSPRPKVNVALGFIIGLLSGISLALLLEALDRTMKSPTQTTDSFRTPLLGLVPRAKDVGVTSVVTSDSNSLSSEAYRALRTAVRFVDPDRPLRSILVTSPLPGEGKTTTAANLALALAQAGERVVLVDADLRRARLGADLGLESALGLTSVVTHQVSPADAMQGWHDLIAVLASGPLPPNPSEILGSQTMAQLIDELVEMSDIVVFDAPPVLPVTDAVVLATQVDGVVLVGRYGSTQRGLAAEARRRLEGVGANVVGCVLNAVPPSTSQGYYEEYRHANATAGEVPPPGRRWTDRLPTRAYGRR